MALIDIGYCKEALWTCLCKKKQRIRSQGLKKLQKNRQISQYRYVWGQSTSLISDDLWKVKMQSQGSDVVISWSKSCVISPFLSMGASYAAQNTISLKHRSQAVPLMCHSWGAPRQITSETPILHPAIFNFAENCPRGFLGLWSRCWQWQTPKVNHFWDIASGTLGILSQALHFGGL